MNRLSRLFAAIILGLSLLIGPVSLNLEGRLTVTVNESQAATWVSGYTRSNGTYVSGHYRSSPDGNPYNNWSYPGNTNPYTGKVATGNPSTYLSNYYGNSSSTYNNTYSYPSYSYTPSYNLGSYTPSYNYSSSFPSSLNSSLSSYDLTSPTNPGDYWTYADSTKTVGASEEFGYYVDSTPYFVFTSSSDNLGVKGYYFLWSKDTTGDPSEDGVFKRKPEFKPRKINRPGTYYLLIKSVDAAGNESETMYATYAYRKAQ